MAIFMRPNHPAIHTTHLGLSPHFSPLSPTSPLSPLSFYPNILSPSGELKGLGGLGNFDGPGLTPVSPISPLSPISGENSPISGKDAKNNSVKNVTLKRTNIKPTAVLEEPKVSYAMLRAHHATACKYVIAKLRWEQTHNEYIPGEDAWHNHNRMIHKLEEELHNCEQAMSLDIFPNVHIPVSFPKLHGPPTKEEHEKKIEEEKAKIKERDAKLDEQFPFLKKLFIGPRTKEQAKKDKYLREQLAEGDFEDLSALLPSENLKLLAEMGNKKPVKRSFEGLRMERERKNVLENLKKEGMNCYTT
ncbi:hypothetical protein M231_06762 [Tremella mesenterica]|uniref:Uncharacterized protein n=1 Tax=Tremella mesenterica TaxID=5217 RepID=A0A4Q1BG64_TREME|nr:hypothetical protein M231_06762 [Tremella mesenterica]